MACKYSNLFGAPNTGPHAYRIANIAVVDVIATVILAWVVSRGLRLQFAWTLLWCFVAGIIAHRIFCVRTTLDRLLFKN